MAPPEFPNPFPVDPQKDEHKQLIANVREKFLTECANSISDGAYSERDVQRMRDEDAWVWRYIRHNHIYEDIPGEAVDQMHASLKWRKEYGVEDIAEDNLNKKLLEKGSAYIRNKDLNGANVLIIHFKQHDKSLSKDAQRHFIYLLERLYFSNLGRKLVILFDMHGAGITNIDMGYVNFMINCHKHYYPDSLAYLLAYEMPLVFSATWTIVKQIMGKESAKKVVFVKKRDLGSCIGVDQLMEDMGGTDSWKFIYDENNISGFCGDL